MSYVEGEARQVSSKKVLFGLIFRSALLFVSTLL